MRIDYMREFLIAADEGSVSSAASRAHQTQPVISKHIRAIEESLHAQLFLRSPKGLTLTPCGEQVYTCFSDMVHTYDALIDTLHEGNSEVCGQLHMGILSMGFDSYIAPIVERFNEAYPNVSFSYSTDSPHKIVGKLIDGQIDIGFLGKANFVDNDTLTYRCIGLDTLHAVVRKDSDIARRGVLFPEDVLGRTLVCLKTRETTEVLNSLVLAAGYRYKNTREVDEVEVAASTVALTDGFFTIPDFMCEQFEASRSVAIVDFSTPVSLPVFFAYRTGSPSHLVTLFLDSLPPDPLAPGEKL